MADGSRSSYKLFVGAIVLLTFLKVSVVSVGALAQDGTQEGARDDTQSNPTETGSTSGGQSLVVPIYPRFSPDDRPLDIEGLKDTYIVLEDGAVVSMADWVLGSLNKSETGIGMSDYQNRLFLGQVARAAVGMKQDLVYRSFKDSGPIRSFIPHTPPAPVQIARGFLSMFVPALGPDWNPAIDGKPTLIDRADYGRDSAIQFEKQFSESLLLSTEDFIYRGQQLNMFNDFQASQTTEP